MTRLSVSNEDVLKWSVPTEESIACMICSRANITINTINNNSRDVVYISEALYHYHSNAFVSVACMSGNVHIPVLGLPSGKAPGRCMAQTDEFHFVYDTSYRKVQSEARVAVRGPSETLKGSRRN